jgi:hypothetical protein
MEGTPRTHPAARKFFTFPRRCQRLMPGALKPCPTGTGPSSSLRKDEESEDKTHPLQDLGLTPLRRLTNSKVTASRAAATFYQCSWMLENIR